MNRIVSNSDSSEQKWLAVEDAYVLGDGFELCFLFEGAEVDALTEARRRLGELTPAFDRFLFREPEHVSKMLRTWTRRTRDPEIRPVIWIDSSCGGAREIWQPLIADLNMNREWFRQHINAFVVIAGMTELQEWFRTFGPDIWSIRATALMFTEPLWPHYKVTASTIEAAISDFKQASRQSHTILGYMIPRVQVKELSECIEAGKSLLCIAPAGFGKSGILSQIAVHMEKVGFETLTLAADRVPVNNTLEMILEPYGLKGSPVQLLRQLMMIRGNDKGIIIIDQLDDLSEFAGDQARMILYRQFGELITDALSHKSLRVVVACRPFDLTHDRRFQELQQDSRLHIVKLDPLGDEVVRDVVAHIGFDKVELSNEQIELLRSPLYLQLLAYSSSRHDQTLPVDELGFFERYWNNMSRRFEHVFGERTWPDAMRAIIKPMEDNKSDRVHMSTLVLTREHISWLLSQGVLKEDPIGNVSFFHGEVTDYIFARSTERDLVEYLSNSLQSLSMRRRVRVTLSHLRREGERYDYIYYERVLRALLFNSNIRAHIKYTVISFLCDVNEPVSIELNVICDAIGSPNEFISRQGVRVVAANTSVSTALMSTRKWSSLFDLPQVPSLGLWLSQRLLEHAMTHDVLQALEVLEFLLGDRSRWAILRSALHNEEIWTTHESLIEFVLHSIEQGVWNQVGRDSVWYFLPKRCPKVAIKVAAIFIRANITKIHGLLESGDKVSALDVLSLPFEWSDLQEAVQTQDTLKDEVIHKLLPCFVELLSDTFLGQHLWPFWSASIYPDDERIFLTVMKNACLVRPTAAVHEVTKLHGNERPLARYFRWAIWASSGSPKNLERAVKELSERIRSHESLNSFYGVEAALDVLNRAYLTLLENRWNELLALVLCHYPKGESPRFSLGIEQMKLLKNLPPASLTIPAKRRLAELMRRFPNYEAPAATPDIGSVHTVIDEPSDLRGHDMSDDDWLAYLSRKPTWKPLSLKSASQETELARYTKEAPSRFICMLTHMFNESIEAHYFNVVISSVSVAIKEGAELSQDDLFAAVRVCLETHPYQTTKNCLWLLDRIAGAPPKDIVAHLLLITQEGEQFMLGMTWSADDPVSVMNAALNYAPSSIVLSMARWLADDLDFFESHRDDIVDLLSSNDVLILASLVEVLLFSLNHDREFSIRMFIELAEHSPDVCLATHWALRFFSYTFSKNLDRLWFLVDRLLSSEQSAMRQQSGILLVWASFSEVVGYKHKLKQCMTIGADEALCKGIAQALLDNRTLLEDMHFKAWLRLCDHEDEQVQRLASNLFSSQKGDGFWDEHMEWVEQFIKTKAFLAFPYTMFRALAKSEKLHTHLTLSAVDRFLVHRGKATGSPSDGYVIDLLIRIHRADALDERVMNRVLNAIDTMIEIGAYEASRVLAALEDD